MPDDHDRAAATPPPLTLDAAARRAGALAWVERRCFEIVGGWVPTVEQLDVKLRFGADAHHHAWHAELWEGRLPKLRDVVADDLVVPASPAVAALFDAVAASGSTVERLVALYRVVLPRKVATYAALAATLSPVSDGPTQRALGLIVADELADWRDGERLVQASLTTPAAVAAAARHLGALEALLVGAGGITGAAASPGAPA